MYILDGFTFSIIFKISIFYQFLICTTHSTKMDFQRGGIHFARKWFIIGMLEWVFSDGILNWMVKREFIKKKPYRTCIPYVNNG